MSYEPDERLEESDLKFRRLAESLPYTAGQLLEKTHEVLAGGRAG